METKKLKPFDLEKAKQGAKLVTRDGRNVRIICWNRANKDFPIVALVERKDKTGEDVKSYTLDGVFLVRQEEDVDLFMAPTVVEQWVNVYKAGCGYGFSYYKSEQEALQHKDNYSVYVTTTKITWEE